MSRKSKPPTVSEHVSVSSHLYQGTIDDSPVPLHFENSVEPIEVKQTWTDTFKQKCVLITAHISNLKLEFVAFLFVFSYVLTRISSTSMILDKVCLVHFGYPEYMCNNLENFTKAKSSIEKLATNYQLGHTLIQTVPAVLLACFMGPWSDHYGRKFPVLLALAGLIVDYGGSAICAYYLKTRVEYYYIPAIFSGITGGIVSMLAVVYSYVSDFTAFGKRTMKYALIEISTGFAMPLGAAAGGWLFKFFGYPAVFLLATCGITLSFIYVLFVLPETRGLDNYDSWNVKLKNLCSCTTFKESFIATAKQRPHKGRRQIALLIISMCFIVITTNSTNDINYLYVHHQFNWGNTEYSTITAIYSIFAVVVILIAVPLLKRFKTGDPVLGLIGTTSLLGKYLGIGLSWKPGVFHFANLFGLLSACAPLAARSRISKVVSNDDLGKVFSFVATAESLLPVLTTVLMSQIFNAAIDVYPGLPFIVLSIFLILPFSVFIWISCLPPLSYEDIDHRNGKTDDCCSSTDL